jgi:glutathione S-transferase
LLRGIRRVKTGIHRLRAARPPLCAEGFSQMILRSTAASPFGRKVRIAIKLLSLENKIEVKETDLNDPADTIRKQNPLGKIPALLLDDGSALFDSRVILDYLDQLAGGDKIIPREPTARFKTLALQALCDGVLDASLLIVYEGRYRPEDKRVPAWIDRQADKVKRGLDALEAAPPPITPMPDVGQITLACALGYRDFRFPGDDWRMPHPRLREWHDKFAAQVPAFAATKPPG